MVNTLSLIANNFSLDTVKQIISIYDSPLYVYQGDILRQTIKRITKSIAYSHKQFHFASVTNGNLSLLQIFKDCGWGIHANTPGDIYLALKAGFSPGNIVYSGSNLSRDEIAQLLNWGITTFNLDSINQLQVFCDVYQSKNNNNFKDIKLGFRLNLPEITGDSRIGVRPNEFKQAVEIASEVNLKISGLHFYRGTGTNATKAFT